MHVAGFVAEDIPVRVQGADYVELSETQKQVGGR